MPTFPKFLRRFAKKFAKISSSFSVRFCNSLVYQRFDFLSKKRQKTYQYFHFFIEIVTKLFDCSFSSKPMNKFSLILFTSSLLLGVVGNSALAQNATTTPVGAMTIAIAPGTGTVYAQTTFSLPLLETGNATGQMAGRITGVTTNTISNADAGWVSSALIVAGSPYYINFTSGANEGRMFQITANTATTLTVNVQGLDLSTLSFVTGASGDTYEIVRGNTLLGVLGTPADGVIGGTASQVSASQADKVTINDPSSGAALTYYFDTTSNFWKRSGSALNQGNLVISPKSAIHYFRISTTPFSLTFTGSVPATVCKHQIPTNGSTFTANYYPVDTTLGVLGIENIADWRKANVNGVTPTTSDKVVLKVGTTYLSYYYDAALSQWRRSGSSLNQASVAIPAGGGIRFIRSGAGGQYSTWSRAKPASYNL